MKQFQKVEEGDEIQDAADDCEIKTHKIAQKQTLKTLVPFKAS